MCRAIDVANFFIDIANNTEDCITNLHVNKLVYFAQAWSLVRRGKPLFNDEIQAWDFGPVVADVYKAFKPCGKERIASVSGDYSANIFTADELDLLLDVQREYGKYSASWLVNLTHEPGAPWDEVYVRNANNVISNDSLIEYFRAQPPLPEYELSECSEDAYIGYHDSDGHFVLPAEWDDDE